MPNATRLCTDCCMFFYSFFPLLLLQSTAQASRTHAYSAEKEMARQRKGEKFRSPIQTRIFLLFASNIRPIITGVINIAQDSITRALNNNNSCKLSKENFQIYVLDDNVPRFPIETEFLLVLMILSNNFKLLLFTAIRVSRMVFWPMCFFPVASTRHRQFVSTANEQFQSGRFFPPTNMGSACFFSVYGSGNIIIWRVCDLLDFFFAVGSASKNKTATTHAYFQRQRYMRLIDIKWSKVDTRIIIYLYLMRYTQIPRGREQESERMWIRITKESISCLNNGLCGVNASLFSTSLLVIRTRSAIIFTLWCEMGKRSMGPSETRTRAVHLAVVENLVTHKIATKEFQMLLSIYGRHAFSTEDFALLYYFRFRSWKEYK